MGLRPRTGKICKREGSSTTGVMAQQADPHTDKKRIACVDADFEADAGLRWQFFPELRIDEPDTHRCRPDQRFRPRYEVLNATEASGVGGKRLRQIV